MSTKFQTAYRRSLAALLLAGSAAAVVLPAMTHEDPSISNGEWWSATPTQAQDRDDLHAANPNPGEWSKADAREFPGCVAYKVHAEAPVVVVRHDGTKERMPLLDAYVRNTNENREDNVWPIGTCR